MVDIMTKVHKYVPAKCYKEPYTLESSEVISISKAKLHPILFGGDQLTASRARGAKKAKVNSEEPLSRLDGLIPIAEDWHTRLNLIEVCRCIFVLSKTSE